MWLDMVFSVRWKLIETEICMLRSATSHWALGPSGGGWAGLLVPVRMISPSIELCRIYTVEVTPSVWQKVWLWQWSFREYLTVCLTPGQSFQSAVSFCSFQEPNELGRYINEVVSLNHGNTESFAQVNSEQDILNQDLVASRVRAAVLHHLWVITDNLTLGKRMVGIELNPEGKLGFSILV